MTQKQEIKTILTKINKQFSDGTVINKNTLEWLNDYLKNQKMPFLNQIAYTTRALLTNHLYLDGNKRTALYIILRYFKEMDLEANEDELFDIITSIAKNNINNIKEIKRRLKKCYTK